MEAEMANDNNNSNLDTAVYSLWFGLDYGSIITSYALCRTIEEMGRKPYLMQKLPELWTDHYEDKDNIAGKFIYDNCEVLNVFDDPGAKERYDNTLMHVTGSDIIWNAKVVGKQAGCYYFCEAAPENSTRIAYGSSFGNYFPAVENALPAVVQGFGDQGEALSRRHFFVLFHGINCLTCFALKCSCAVCLNHGAKINKFTI